VTNEKIRLLIHVPIVHDQADLGPLKDRARAAYLAKGGEAAWRASRAALTEFWNAVAKALDGLKLDWTKVRLYQDSLPVCGLEEKIIRDLAKQGGANHRILLKLIERGARIEGTEDAGLLRKEYELIIAGAPIDAGVSASDKRAYLQDFMERRDRFIAQRIDKTLLQGETGILFLGALHRAAEFLPRSLQVVSLADKLRKDLSG
jgi:hypothetical protein